MVCITLDVLKRRDIESGCIDILNALLKVDCALTGHKLLVGLLVSRKFQEASSNLTLRWRPCRLFCRHGLVCESCAAHLMADQISELVTNKPKKSNNQDIGWYEINMIIKTII